MCGLQLDNANQQQVLLTFHKAMAASNMTTPDGGFVF
jgi:hypothetical protein